MSEAKNTELKEMTIGSLLRETAERYPNNTAVRTGDLSFTYSQLDARVDMLARRFIGMGIRKDDHVGVICRASWEIIIIIYALSRIGAVPCLLNTGLKKPELNDLLIRGDIHVLLVGEGLRHISFEELEGEGRDEYSLPLRLFRISSLEERFPVSLEKLKKLEAAVEPGDASIMLFTSGSTGPAKPVISSHFSRVNCGRMQAKDLCATEKDVFLCALPIFHCFSLSVNVFASCAVGACLCIPASHHTGDLLDAIEKWGCTVFSAVPAIYHAIIRRTDIERRNTASLRTGFIGGSMYPKQLFIQAEKTLGMTLMSSLGQTEATGGITTSDMSDPLELRASTVGHFMDHVEGKIISIEDGRTLGAGESGEICARGYIVMQGYYNMPQETTKVLDADGWLHTGDMGYIDEKGYVHMAGRIKDLIIRGGENISPIEIESVFADDENVVCCKAVAVPDDHYGEEICLFVEVKDHQTVTKDYIRSKVSEKLADYKVPKYVEMVDRIPKTPTGKVLTRELERYFPICPFV